jgi:acyl-CoA thioesterase
MKSPKEIITLMLSKDAFSIWMGIEVLSIEEGTCELRSKIKTEMLNGFGILHGGISYSLADSALAFASNSYGYKSVSIETSISHVRPVKAGDTITAKAVELHRGFTLGIYEITITNQENKKIALFKGTVFITADTW